MNAIRRTTGTALAAAALLALPARAADTLRYAEDDGSIRTVELITVIKEEPGEFRAKVREGGRSRALVIPSRHIVSLQRGDPDDVNQWSKKLASAYRKMAGGQLLTESNVPGAEEDLEKIAYSVEPGVKGQEREEAISPWQNMYGLAHLISVRLRIGTGGKDPERLKKALANVDEFVKRTQEKAGKKIDWDVPFEKGTTKKSKIYAWGENWLLPHVLLDKARILRELGEAEKAAAAFDDVAELVKKNDLSPQVLADAISEKAQMQAAGKSSDDAESILRESGNRLRGDVRQQKDAYGRAVVARAANRALLRGADLLLASAAEGKVSYEVPLARYRQLKEAEGREDPALGVGAQAGIGICLTETGKGREAYDALLGVVIDGYQHPDQVARALYYLGKAAPLFAQELEKQGGKGDFLREEGRRWWADLAERFPVSPWAQKAKG
ncbi:MAG: hypothetical protein ACREID_02090 [Planctomycetota bacterium]